MDIKFQKRYIKKRKCSLFRMNDNNAYISYGYNQTEGLTGRYTIDFA